MPFGSLLMPAIGLSLLKAGLEPLRVRSEILYLNLQFARFAGLGLYVTAAGGRDMTHLLGEWLFAKAVFGDTEARERRYLREIVQPASKHSSPPVRRLTARQLERLLRVRREVDSFLDRALDQVLARGPKLIGFTVTAQQHLPSLSLAQRIKRTAPETFIVLGGPGCLGIMGWETIRQFPFVDAVVSGEGDIVFPKLVQRVLNGRPVGDLPGVYTPASVGRQCHPDHLRYAPTVQDLDELPIPDYDDFFAQVTACGLDGKGHFELTVETSRGCWWGQRQQCLFCAVNGVNLRHRQKSPQRALREIERLATHYPEHTIRAVDNVLPKDYLRDLAPALAHRGGNARLFYEVRPTLTKDQLRVLRDAGVLLIQPGIESLSTKVLRLMRKGVTALQNIQLLKWCREIGLHPWWNIIYGFPNEPAEEYAKMADLIPDLVHLSSPYGVAPVKIMRYSPLFDEAQTHGLVDLEPVAAYSSVYPFPLEVTTNLAYLFQGRRTDGQSAHAYAGPMVAQAAAWIEGDDQYECFYEDDGDQLHIWDERPASPDALTVLRGHDRMLYLACDRVRHDTQLQQQLSAESGRTCGLPAVRARLSSLVARGLMARDGGHYVSLAVPVGEYSPREQSWSRYRERRRLHEYTESPTQVTIVGMPEGALVTAAEIKHCSRRDRGPLGHAR